MQTASPQTDWKSVAKVALGAFCYSTLILFTRLTQGLDAMSIAFFRAAFAFLFFCLLLVWFREPLKIHSYRSFIWRLIASGITTGITASLYIYSVQHTTAANAALLVNSAPIYIAFLAPWLLKEQRPRFTWISLVCILTGIVLITGIIPHGIAIDSLSGILAGVLSGFTYSLILLLSRSMRGRVGGITQSFWSTGVAALVMLPFALQAPHSAVISNLPILAPLGIISLGLASLMYFLALQKVKAQVVSVVAILEPVCGVLLGLLVFHEPLGLTAVLGSILILLGIYLISR